MVFLKMKFICMAVVIGLTQAAMVKPEESPVKKFFVKKASPDSSDMNMITGVKITRAFERGPINCVICVGCAVYRCSQDCVIKCPRESRQRP